MSRFLYGTPGWDTMLEPRLGERFRNRPPRGCGYSIGRCGNSMNAACLTPAGPDARLSPPCSRRATRGSRGRSEEHTSELQSLMRISYAVFCLKQKTIKQQQKTNTHT